MVLDSINKLLDNKTVTLVISMILALYSALAAPALPDSVILFFDTIVGKVLLLFLIGFTASRNIQVSLMIAVAFVITLHIANKRTTEQYINFLKRENFISLNNQTEEADVNESFRSFGFDAAVRQGVEKFEGENIDEEIAINEGFISSDDLESGEEGDLAEGFMGDVNIGEEEDLAEGFSGNDLDEERFVSVGTRKEMEEIRQANEEANAEPFSNSDGSFYNNMNQWSFDGVKPAHNLSGNSNNFQAPVAY